MLPPLPSDEEFSSLTTFPIMEGLQWEYKETLISSEKLLQNVCAFLNRKGGYLIVGIRDIDLAILGIPDTILNKTIDSFILKCDNIYHQGLITRKDGTAIHHDCVFARTLFLNGKRLVIVKVEPEPNTLYVCHDGISYIRLSASNYKVPQNPKIMYSLSDFQSLEGTIRSRFKREYASILFMMERQIELEARRSREIESNMKTMQEELYSKILKEKEDAEKRLEATKGFKLVLLKIRWSW
jgi:predicted HTH transcriptional regulator